MNTARDYITELLDSQNIEYTEDGKEKIIKYPTYQSITIRNKKYRVFDNSLVTTYDIDSLDGLITFNRFHYNLMRKRFNNVIYLPIVNLYDGKKEESDNTVIYVNNYFEVYNEYKNFITENSSGNIIVPKYFNLWKTFQQCLDRVPGEPLRYWDIKKIKCNTNFFLLGIDLILDLVPIVTHFLNNPDSDFYLLSLQNLQHTFLFDELKLYFDVCHEFDFIYKLGYREQNIDISEYMEAL